MSHEHDKNNGGRDRSWQAGSSRFNRAAGQQRSDSGSPRGGRRDFDGRDGERRSFDRDGGRRSFDRSERGFGRDGGRDFDRRDGERRQGWGSGERRSFDRDGGRSFDRRERFDDRPQRREGWGGGGQGRSFERDGRRSFDRSERGFGRDGGRDYERRDGERRQGWGSGERRSFDRDGGRSFDRRERFDDRPQRREGWGGGGQGRSFERDGRRSFDRSERGFGRDFDRRDGERRDGRGFGRGGRDFDRREGGRGFERRDERRTFEGGRGFERRDERRTFEGGRGFERRPYKQGERGRDSYGRSFDGSEREVRSERDRFAARQAERGEGQGRFGGAKRQEVANDTPRQAPSQGLYSGPEFPEDVTDKLLDRPTRLRLRTLSERSAEVVAKHLVMVQRHLATDPELAWAHAQAAVRNAGRVDVVREAAALAAYASGRFTDTLREVRALRRLSGRHVHIAIEADSERALGRPEKALEIIAGAERYSMDTIERAELAMVASGVRADLGQLDAALLVVEQALEDLKLDQETTVRLQSVRADRLRDLDRIEEADALVAQFGLDELEEDEVEVFDVEEDFDAEDALEVETDSVEPEDSGESANEKAEMEDAAPVDPAAGGVDDVAGVELLEQAQNFDIDAEVDELLAQIETDAEVAEQEDLFDVDGMEPGEVK